MAVTIDLASSDVWRGTTTNDAPLSDAVQNVGIRKVALWTSSLALIPDWFHSSTRTVGVGATDTINLQSTLIDGYGRTLGATGDVQEITIYNNTALDSWDIGGNWIEAWANLAVGQKIRLWSDGELKIRRAAGMSVAANSTLTIFNGTGASSTYDIIIIGST